MANQKLSELYKVNDIELKEVAKPDSVTFENGYYKFLPLDKYYELKAGSVEYAESLAVKVEEARLAAMSADKQHKDAVTQNLIGNASDETVDKLREVAEHLKKVADEKKYAEQEALMAYSFRNDPRKMIERYRNEGAPYLRYVMTTKEIAMAKARQKYLESIEEFLDGLEAMHGLSSTIKELRYELTGVPSISPLVHVETSLIRNGSSTTFPFELQHEEVSLIRDTVRTRNLQRG